MIQYPNQSISRKRSLLYVEDNLVNVALIRELVARCQDLRFLAVIDGDLGILLARTSVPAVIVMDINLSGKSGFEVLKILRDDPITMHIPVIALSSNAYPHDVEKGIEAGFFRYLTKPYKLDSLLDAVNAALKLDAREPQTEKVDALGVPYVPRLST